ncbi:hypothetical protein ABK040_012164 [Willaertia magna]
MPASSKASSSKDTGASSSKSSSSTPKKQAPFKFPAKINKESTTEIDIPAKKRKTTASKQTTANKTSATKVINEKESTISNDEETRKDAPEKNIEKGGTKDITDEVMKDVPTTEDLAIAKELVPKKSSKSKKSKKKKKKKNKESIETGKNVIGKKKKDLPVTQEEIYTNNQKLFKPQRIGNPFLQPQWFLDTVDLFKGEIDICVYKKEENIINEKETDPPKLPPEQLEYIFDDAYFNFGLNPERFVDYMNKGGTIKYLIPNIATFDHISYGYWKMQKKFKHLHCDNKTPKRKDAEGVHLLKDLKGLQYVDYIMFVIPNVGKQVETAVTIDDMNNALVGCFKKGTEMIGIIFDFKAFVHDYSRRRFIIVDFLNNQIAKKIENRDGNEFTKYIESVLSRVLLVFLETVHPNTRNKAKVCLEYDIRDAFVLVNEIGNEINLGTNEITFKENRTNHFFRNLNYYFEIVRTIAFNPYPSLVIREEKIKENENEADAVYKEIKEDRKDIVFMIRFTEQTIKHRHMEYIEMILKSQYEQNE